MNKRSAAFSKTLSAAGALIFMVAAAPSVRAQSCTTYPNTLTNGATADANQVMANFNCAALLGGANFTGKVGIGTTNPLENFQVTGSPYFATNYGGAFPSYGGSIGANGGTIIGWNGQSNTPGETDFVNFPGAGSGGFDFVQANVSGTVINTPMVITGGAAGTGGKVGIATTAPTDILDVYAPVVFGNAAERLSMGSGSIGFNRKISTGVIYNSSYYAYQLQHTDGATAAADYLALQVYTPSGGNVSGSAIAVNGAAQVSIDTVQSTYAFYVNGSAAGTTGWTNASDARLKTQIADIADPLGLVAHLRGVRFRWRPPGEREVGQKLLLPVDEPQIGFIAQEVAKVVPEAVSAPKAGTSEPYGVKDSSIIPILVEAIKAQQAEIKELQAEVAALRAPK